LACYAAQPASTLSGCDAQGGFGVSGKECGVIDTGVDVNHPALFPVAAWIHFYAE